MVKYIMTTLDEVREAYIDLDPETSWLEAQNRRNLDFRASRAVSRNTAFKIMNHYVKDYNEFEASFLNKLPANSRITLAREGSVCIYVKGKLPGILRRSLKASEFSYDKKTNETRIWWD